MLTVVLVPLVFVTRGDLVSASAIAYIEVPKIALLRTLVALMAVLWIIEWGIRGRFPFRFSTITERSLLKRETWLLALPRWLRGHPERWLILAVAFFFATILLSTILSASFNVSMWGETPGEDGYGAYTIITYALLFAVVATHLKTTNQVMRLLAAIVIMGLLVAVFAVLQDYGHAPWNLKFPVNLGRSTSTLGNPILAGAVMLITISISLTLAVLTLREPIKTAAFWWKLGLWVLVLSVQILGIIFTSSRGPWYGTTAALIVLLGMASIFMGWRLLARAVLVLGLAVIIAAAVLTLSSGSSSATEVGPADAPANTPTEASEVVERITSIGQNTLSGGLGGRLEIWQESWSLMIDRPWFEFDNLSLSGLRPLIGYGPDLFRYVYLLESDPQGPDLVPRESAHAHNFFIHQGVEAGFLGLLSSLGIFVIPLLAGGYLLIRHGPNYSVAHKLVLAGLIATLVGRSLEQMVGLARVSDLTIFWVLLAVLVALPVAMRTPHGPSASSGTAHVRRSYDSLRFWRVLVVVCLVGLIGTLTWMKTINYPRAAVITANAVKQSRDGNLQSALTSYNQAIDLAPDVWINYNRRATVYLKYKNRGQAPRELDCSLEVNSPPYKECLTKCVYLDNLTAAEQRPFNFRSRHALALSTSALATLTGDKKLEEDTLRFFKEVTDLVPTSWQFHNQLAAAYLQAGRPEAALDAADRSLSITGDHPNSTTGYFLRGIANRELGQARAAVESFNDILRLNSRDEKAYNHRALAYWIMGQVQQSLQDLDEAIRLNPEYAEAFSNRGYIQQQLGQPQSAITDLDEAIRLDPQFELAFNNRGLAYADLGTFQRAIEDYDEAIRLNGDYLQAYLNRGVAYVNLGQPAQALFDSDQAIRLDPRGAAAYALKAMAYTQQGVDAEASQNLKRAVELGFDRSVLETRIDGLNKQR